MNRKSPLLLFGSHRQQPRCGGWEYPAFLIAASVALALLSGGGARTANPTAGA